MARQIRDTSESGLGIFERLQKTSRSKSRALRASRGTWWPPTRCRTPHQPQHRPEVHVLVVECPAFRTSAKAPDRLRLNFSDHRCAVWARSSIEFLDNRSADNAHSPKSALSSSATA